MNKGLEFLKLLLVMIGIVLLTAVAGIAATMFGLDPLAQGTTLLLVFITQLIIALSAYFLVKKEDGKIDGQFVKNRGFTSDSWKMIVIGLGLAGLGNILIGAIIQLLPDNSWVNFSLDMVEQAFSTTTTFQNILMFITACIIAPIAEEYLFRGYFFEKTHRIYPLAATVVLNGLVFGLYHMNLLQGINTFIMGIILSIVYYYRQNITDAIIIHLVNNVINTLAGYVPQYANIIGWILIVSIFVGGYFVYKIIKDGKKIVPVKSDLATDNTKVYE